MLNIKKEELHQDKENLHLWLNKDGTVVYSEQSDDEDFLAHVEKDYEFNNDLYYQDLDLDLDYDISNLEVYSKGDLKGYAQGFITFKNKGYSETTHEFLYRISDSANGKDNTLVSIDYGYKVPFIDDIWDCVETYIKGLVENGKVT